MPRPKKDAKILNIKLASPISEQLEKFCEESGVTKTKAAEKIFGQFFDNYFSKSETERKMF